MILQLALLSSSICFVAVTHRKTRRAESQISGLTMSKLTLSIILIWLVGVSRPFIVRLEGRDDIGAWKDISCRFMESFEEYSQTTCRAEVYIPAKEYFTDITKGAWNTCSNPTCSFVYNDDSLPQPESISIRVVAVGESVIIISKKSSDSDAYFTEIGFIKALHPGFPENENWMIHTLNVSDIEFDILAIFLSVPDKTSFALIDYIELNYGPDADSPTVPPPTLPPPPKYSYEVNRMSDLTSEFVEVTCNYLDKPSNLSGSGCPKFEELDPTSIGLWAPCEIPSCYFKFYAGKDRPAVSEIRVEGAFQSQSSFKISKKSDKPNSVYNLMTSTEFTSNKNAAVFPLINDCESGTYIISIFGPAVIDRIWFNLNQDDLDPKYVCELSGIEPIKVSLAMLVLVPTIFYASI